ncbi:MAG: hypothetical protein ACREN6_05255 [Gemmatimonadaceae bacterium]
MGTLHTIGTIALVAFPALALAQIKAPLTEPATVPTELAAALIGAGGINGNDEPRLLVGAIPEWVTPRIVVPGGAKVLGAAFQGTSVLAVINIPYASETIVTDLKQQLLQRGWKAIPVRTPMAIGGFLPAPALAPEGPPLRVTLCEGPNMMSVFLARRDSHSADVVYRLSTPSGISVCNAPQMPTGMYRSPFPPLYNPTRSADARMTGDCSTTMLGSQGQGTTLRTALSADSLLEHYGRQLTDSGWTAARDRGVTVGRTYSKTDASGAPVELVLTVASSARDESCRDVNMQVRTLRKP